MRTLLYASVALWTVATLGTSTAAQQGRAASSSSAAAIDAAEAPAYNAAGELVRPAAYREWVFVSSGLGMTYGPAQAAAGRPPMFDNVFVTRSAYRAFMNTGTWPDKTMFALEIRRSLEQVSINNGGRTQGEVAAVEVAVKDVQRFKDTGGWAYFDFGAGDRARAAATPLPSTASCYTCHAANTAVDNTFVQFYPELFAAATRHGTIKPTYDPARKP
jgi:hypothetical protein